MHIKLTDFGTAKILDEEEPTTPDARSRDDEEGKKIWGPITLHRLRHKYARCARF